MSDNLINSTSKKAVIIITLIAFVTAIFGMFYSKDKFACLTDSVEINTVFRIKTEDALPQILNTLTDISKKLNMLETKIEVEKEIRKLRESGDGNFSKISNSLNKLEKTLKDCSPLYYSKED